MGGSRLTQRSFGVGLCGVTARLGYRAWLPPDWYVKGERMSFGQDAGQNVARDSVDARAHERQRLVADVRHFSPTCEQEEKDQEL